ncbi:putative integral membrane protein [Rosellinia necatrix]|uniref:Putative integral membrane protein n=1 Tax=Rosellinia necatrix TaxID=77044 RepID=A0A1W2TF22_ROSNE|nr:putative integral membrane protein [Rosellinia necatrix]
MSLGSIATAAAVIKTIQLRNLATPDFTWDAVSLVYWFIAENWIIIIGACVPTIKPLFTNNWGIFTRLASLVSGKSFASTAATHDESSNHCNNNDLESQNSYGLESRRLLYEQARPQVGGSGDMPMRPLPPLPSHDPGKN